MKHSRIGAALAAALLSCSLLTSCDSQGGTEVTYMTAFGTFGREAYVYVAQAKGYFEDAGIKVTIHPGQGTGDNLKLMTAGKADFAPVGAFSLAQAISGEKRLGVKAVAALDQHTMASIMTKTTSGIVKPSDLAGRSVGGLPNSEVPALLTPYAYAVGIDPDSVKHVAATPTQLPGLLAGGSVDAIGQYVVSQGLIRKAVGGDVVIFPFRDHLPDVYGALLSVRQDLAAKDPELVRRFTAALMKGLEYSIDHPDEAGQIMQKAVPAQDATQTAAELKLLAPFDRVEGTAVGSVDEARAKRMLAEFETVGLLKRKLTFEDLFETALLK
ncbi:ABC transporter substrate-binding protein [Streptosporangium saharense]|uniref:ABC transporter substrate-binding protein n=1 Tax=Streptosporangium saharense TaxID=1706840 RepID=UPI0036D0A832